MSRKTKAIANYFLEKAESDGTPVTILKLLKLMYFAHGWHLAIKHGDALIDEEIEAWQYGPVIPSIYRHFRHYGSKPIQSKAYTRVTPDGYERDVPILECDAETDAILTRVWNLYGHMTAGQLVRLTHEEGTPWKKIWNDCNGERFAKIPNGLIQAFFESKMPVAHN